MILKVIPNNFVYVLFNGILFFIPLERKIEMKIVMKKVQINLKQEFMFPTGITVF